MDIDAELLRVRREARIGELEFWLAIMVVRQGRRNGSGYQLVLDGEEINALREQVPHQRIAVEFDLDLDTGVYTFDVL